MPFTTNNQLQVELHDGVKRRFHTLKELTYHDSEETGGTGATFTVPAGTESDGASIPRVFHSVLSPFGVYLKSAVVHDYLYQQGSLHRKIVDDIFKRAMKSQGVNVPQRSTMHRFVRIFGGVIWRKRHGKKGKKV